VQSYPLAKEENMVEYSLGLDALIRSLRSLPCGVTVQTFFLSLADLKPSAVQTVLVACQVPAKEAAEAIALKDCLAPLTADAVIIPDSFGVVAKHKHTGIIYYSCHAHLR
jgi:hypothetical protein